jgi:hypothetical protein
MMTRSPRRMTRSCFSMKRGINKKMKMFRVQGSGFRV